MSGLYADVALALPAPGIFQYEIPDELRDQAAPGKRVYVSVRNRKMVGYVVGITAEKQFEQLRPIDAVIDPVPVLDGPLKDLTRWMAETYQCSWGQAIEAAMPVAFKKGKLHVKSRSRHPAHSAECVDPTALELTSGQRAAYETVAAALEKRPGAAFLLHGVTGSGKTEIYMHLIARVLESGRGAIVLVPEISLTPQTVDRFHSRFGEELAILHSRLSAGKRLEEWHRIRQGRARVVVGARSALFAPLPSLGLVVIDEEQETSYKQDETPRYHARELAAERCRLEGGVLLLGSATPSLESYHDALGGRIGYLRLPERIERRPLPEVSVVDMRRQPHGKFAAIFSKPLEQAVRECLARSEQAMVLLNRRGFSTYLHCSSCGYVAGCKNCKVSLVYHHDKSALYCHLCEYRALPDRLCPACQKSHLHYFGLGTQKVEAEAARLFPGARIGRMDTDSTSRKDAHERILRAFKRREIDLLIGTQMIAKGHDFPHVSLIGVVSADTALHLPDFRAAERTFDLLTQVAGRAGRGDIPGRVIIQTHVPGHYAIRAAAGHDYEEFYRREIEFRRELGMPPFSRLVRVGFAGSQERDTARLAMTLARALETDPPPASSVLGPAPAAVSRQAGQYRWNLFLKGPDPSLLGAWLTRSLASFKRGSAALTVDVDPQ